MDKKIILDTIKQIREKGPKRKFSQAFDLIINLKGINIKKEDQKIDKFFVLPFSKGRKSKICAIVDNDLLKQAKEVCDIVIFKDELNEWKDKIKQRKLAIDCEFFIAQANLMSQVASVFGKVFGPRNKMPNPKSGCVVSGNAQLKGLYDRLQNTVRIITKNEPIIKVIVGNESMKDEEVTENILAVYNNVVGSLSQGEHNLKNILLKLTMGPIFKLTKK